MPVYANWNPKGIGLFFKHNTLFKRELAIIINLYTRMGFWPNKSKNKIKKVPFSMTLKGFSML